MQHRTRTLTPRTIVTGTGLSPQAKVVRDQVIILIASCLIVGLRVLRDLLRVRVARRQARIAHCEGRNLVTFPRPPPTCATAT